MAQTKEFFTRIVHKHDTEANWDKATAFVPLAGEIIVYDKDSTHNYARVKIGDGTTKINNLPFTNTVFSVNGKTGVVDLSGYDVKAIPTFGQHNYNANECYDAGLFMISNGLGCPSSSQYGALLSLPYRKANGNGTPDFGTQIYIPNGDDSGYPNSLFFRTSLRDSWNSWKEVSTVGHIHAASEITSGTIAAARLPIASSSTLGGVKVGSNISISSGTISLTKANVTAALGYTPPTSDTNTTYTFATGDSNGQIKITPSSGSATNVSVKGLGTAAYTASTSYATAAQGTKADDAMPKAGGKFTGTTTTTSSYNIEADSTHFLMFGMSNGDYVISVNNNGTWDELIRIDTTGKPKNTTSGLRRIEVRTSSASGTLQSTGKIIGVRK